MAKTYEPIATTTLGSSSSTVTFSSIPATYTDLVLVSSSTQTAGPVNSRMRFNGDSSSNYSRTWLSGQGSGAYSGRGSNRTSFELDYYTSPGTGNLTIVHVMNYANTTTYKTVLDRTGRAAEGTEAVVGLWRKTPEAITSIEYSLDGAGSFAAGSTFTLYGIKAA